MCLRNRKISSVTTGEVERDEVGRQQNGSQGEGFGQGRDMAQLAFMRITQAAE